MHILFITKGNENIIITLSLTETKTCAYVHR